jgi:hypothetical protein
MRRKLITIIASAMIAVASLATVAAQDDEGVSINMEPVDDSGYSGTVTLTPENGETFVSISLAFPVDLDAENDEPYELAIHEGTCDDPGDIAHELEGEEAGLSQTTVDASIDELTDGEYLIALHQGGDAESGILACGEITAAPDEDDDAVVDDDDDAVVDDDDDAVVDDEDDAVVDDDDDAVVDDEDDAVVDDDDDAVVDDDDDAVVDDDDDAVVDDDDDAVVDDTDDAVVDDEDDDSEDLVPAAGSINDGFGAEAGALLMVLAAAGSLGMGLLVRRRTART